MWVIPTVLGLLAAGATWGIIAATDDDKATAHDDEEGLIWVFPTGPMALDGPHDVLVIAPDHDGPSQDMPDIEHFGPVEAHWVEDGIGIVEADFYTINCVTTPCPQPEGPSVLQRAPEGSSAFGVRGYNATRLTFYAFNADGQVLASNADDEDLARFELAEEFSAVPDVVWYLGDADSPPPGTSLPPAPIRPVLAEAHPYLANLPVGGVASVATDEFEWLYGTLYVTVRIDELVYAP